MNRIDFFLLQANVFLIILLSSKTGFSKFLIFLNFYYHYEKRKY